MNDPLKSFTDGINRVVKYIRDALGITPDEPPIISDSPPIHLVDGEIKLGDSDV